MIGIIAAVTVNGVIGVENKLPFDYPEDMKHFRTTTANSTVIMGRKTFEGIGRPLPKRRNVIISSTMAETPGVEVFSSVSSAMHTTKSEDNVWFIGGASIYEEAMLYADKIVLTITPDYNLHPKAIKFPWINPLIFHWQGAAPLNEEMWEEGTSRLYLATYKRSIQGLNYEQIISKAKLHTI
jgi:dihydrofolate reductase